MIQIRLFKEKEKEGGVVNLALGGLATKARACKGVNKERNPRVIFHVLGSVQKCEGMNLHTPK
jgi:hypothetical protein